MTFSRVHLGFIIFAILITIVESCDVSTKDDLVERLKDPCKHRVIMHVSFTKRLDCDETVPLRDLYRKPIIRYMYTNSFKTYTLLMVSPDTPGSDIDTLTFHLNWAAINTQGIDLLVGRNAKSAIDYERPMYFKHDARYQVIVFEEPERGKVKKPGTNRHGFKLWDYMNKNNLCAFKAAFQFRARNYY